MGGEVSSVPLGAGKPKQQVSVAHQILIVLRGARKTGKTSLLCTMKGMKFQPNLKPTPIMQATELIWTPFSSPNDRINVTVWDVVDHALQPLNSPKKDLPDATTVDTFSRADGVIITYDPRDDDSAKYALEVINEAPEGIPLLLLANFVDALSEPPSIHPILQEACKRVYHLPTSMKTNLGLSEIAQWLDLPLHMSLKKLYSTLLANAKEELEQVKKEIGMDQKPKEEIIEDTKPFSFDENAAMDDKGFWDKGGDAMKDGQEEKMDEGDFWEDNEEIDFDKINFTKPLPKLDFTTIDDGAPIQQEAEEEKEVKHAAPKKENTLLKKISVQKAKAKPKIVAKPKVIPAVKPAPVIKEAPPAIVQNVKETIIEEEESMYSEFNEEEESISKPQKATEKQVIAPIIFPDMDEAPAEQNENDFWPEDETEIPTILPLSLPKLQLPEEMKAAEEISTKTVDSAKIGNTNAKSIKRGDTSSKISLKDRLKMKKEGIKAEPAPLIKKKIISKPFKTVSPTAQPSVSNQPVISKEQQIKEENINSPPEFDYTEFLDDKNADVKDDLDQIPSNEIFPEISITSNEKEIISKDESQRNVTTPTFNDPPLILSNKEPLFIDESIEIVDSHQDSDQNEQPKQTEVNKIPADFAIGNASWSTNSFDMDQNNVEDTGNNEDFFGDDDDDDEIPVQPLKAIPKLDIQFETPIIQPENDAVLEKATPSSTELFSHEEANDDFFDKSDNDEIAQEKDLSNLKIHTNDIFIEHDNIVPNLNQPQDKIINAEFGTDTPFSTYNKQPLTDSLEQYDNVFQEVQKTDSTQQSTNASGYESFGDYETFEEPSQKKRRKKRRGRKDEE